MLIDRDHRGFTLVEILVALAIVVIMLMLSLPEMSSYLQSSKLATEAQNLQTGLQLARTEAIRRNQLVSFVLTNTQVNVPNLANVAVANGNGPNWLVRTLDPAAAPPANLLIDAKGSQEGAGAAVSSIVVTPLVPAGFNGIIQFDGFGASQGGIAYTLRVSNPAGGACAPAGPMRCVDVRVTPGGRVSVCDPLAAAGDSRSCL